LSDDDPGTKHPVSYRPPEPERLLVKQHPCNRCQRPTYRQRRIYNTLQRYDWGTPDEPGTGFSWLESYTPLRFGAWSEMFICWACGGDCPSRLPHRADRSTRRRALRRGLDFNALVRKVVKR
jgi:hypothetical protein